MITIEQLYKIYTSARHCQCNQSTIQLFISAYTFIYIYIYYKSEHVYNVFNKIIYLNQIGNRYNITYLRHQ